MDNITVNCPACDGEVSYRISGHQEYQGEHPHGGMVWHFEDCFVVEDCNCNNRTMEQLEEMDSKALDSWVDWMEGL